MVAFWLFLKELIENFTKFEVIVYFRLLEEIDTIFQNTKVYEGLQHGGKQKFLSLPFKDLEV